MFERRIACMNQIYLETIEKRNEIRDFAVDLYTLAGITKRWLLLSFYCSPIKDGEHEFKFDVRKNQKIWIIHMPEKCPLTKWGCIRW